MQFFDWFPLVLIYILTNSVSKVFQKIALKDQEVDSTAFSSLFLFTVGVLTLPALFFEDLVFSTSWKVWLILLLNGALYATCLVLFYRALKGTEVSQVEAIATTRTFWFVILGIIFFNEALNLNTFLGVGLIFLGLFIIYWNKSHALNLNKSHVYTFIYAFIISCSYALDKYLLSYFSVALYQVIIYILPAVLIPVAIPGTTRHLKYLIKPRKGTYILLASTVMQMISTLALYAAYKSGGALSIVGPIAQTSTVITITAGILILKENWNLKRKVLGIAISLIGVFVLRFF